MTFCFFYPSSTLQKCSWRVAFRSKCSSKQKNKIKYAFPPLWQCLFFTALALNLMLRSQSHENLVEGGCTIYFCLVFGHIAFRSYWQSLAMCFAALKNAEFASSSSGLLLSLTRVVTVAGTVDEGRPDGNLFGPTQTSLQPRLWKKLE